MKKADFHFPLKKIKSEIGATFIELIIIMVVLGVVLPMIFAIIGQLGIHHFRNEEVYRSVSYANTKMEEIIAFKQINDDWADNINDFVGSESLADGFARKVIVTNINNWISDGTISKNAFQIDVIVTPILGNAYTVTVVFAEN